MPLQPASPPPAPPGTLRLVGKSALIMGGIALGVGVLGLGMLALIPAFFGAGTLLAGFAAWGASLQTGLSSLAVLSGGGALFGGAWRGVEEVSNKRLTKIEATAAEIRAARNPAAPRQEASQPIPAHAQPEQPAKDFSQPNESAGIEHSGQNVEQVLARRRQALLDASTARGL